MSTPTLERSSLVSPLLGRARELNARFPALQVAILAGLFAYGAVTLEGYSSKRSIYSMLVLAAFLGLAAAGQTLVILLGGIDLSVPFLIGGANVLTAELTGGRGWPFVAVCFFLAAVALAIGAVNGYLSHRFGIHSLIITLGTGTMVGGGVLVYTRAQLTAGAPDYLGDFVSPARDTWFIPLPPLVVFWIGISAVLIVVLAKSAVGRRLYATGANPRAAKLALVSTTRVWAGTFAVSAFFSALTGVLLAGFSGTGLFNIGDPYLFTSIASVVIGGTSLLGARGDYFRTVLGALILIQITTILIGKGYDSPTQQVILGSLIVIFVATYGRELHVRNRI